MKSILAFLITQLIGLATLYLLYGYVFSQFNGWWAWSIYGLVVLFYLAYLIYDLLLLIRKRRLVKNFNW